MRPLSSSLLPHIPRKCGRGATRSTGAAAAVPERSRLGSSLTGRLIREDRHHDRRSRLHRRRVLGGGCFRGPSPAVFAHSAVMTMATATTTAGVATSQRSFYHQLRRLSTTGGGRGDGKSGGGERNGDDDDEEVSSDEEGGTTSKRRRRGRARGPLATLRVHGPDRRGIVASFSNLLYSRGCSIVDSASEQSVDTETGADLFFQRILFDYGECKHPTGGRGGGGEGGPTDDSCRDGIEADIRGACEELGMHGDLDWDYGLDEGNDANDEEEGGTVPTVSSGGKRDRNRNGRKRVAVMVSRYDHCLWELLLRHRAGELPNCDVVAVLSNHPDLQHVADTFSVPYHVFPIDSPSDKAEVERRELDLLIRGYDVDVVVLARYMQVLSEEFCATFPNRIINIHHSFLPAFKGGRPYHRAHERGVKLIGATAHYATVDLDEGPIIEQDIARITHRDTVKDLIRKGRTLEKTVLVHALRAHLEDRIIVYKNRCIVFGE